ncbi:MULTISPECIES: hypothetical protein [Actinoalloteichus]|uniref:Uncharacterized protein n=2 Tax=Actinoalloteichus cyanogriseus TaxID=2893586 RepID=A0ABT1JMB9_ACTCY|nr:hypothetical protein [Actinoalloteichus caeruleus]MCP2332861.1 hypothetical protein [Actinoalloteichus caeruleus DSM 43889]
MERTRPLAVVSLGMLLVSALFAVSANASSAPGFGDWVAAEPGVNGPVAFTGVAGIGHGRTVAVGVDDQGPVALHERDGVWTALRLPGLAEPAAVAGPAPDQVWAVGGGLVWRFDGVRWTTEAVPASGDAGRAELVDVAVASSGEVWVVGTTRPPGGGERPLLLHRTATEGRWHVQEPPVAGRARLTAAHARNASDVWVVGERPDLDAPLILRWDGRSWAEHAGPAGEDGSVVLLDVVGVSDREAWAVGRALAHDGDAEPRPFLAEWDGRHWSIPDTPIADADLRAVTVYRSEPVAVGRTAEGGPYLLRRSDRHWQPWRVTGLDGLALVDVDAAHGSVLWTVGTPTGQGLGSGLGGYLGSTSR